MGTSDLSLAGEADVDPVHVAHSTMLSIAIKDSSRACTLYVAT